MSPCLPVAHSMSSHMPELPLMPALSGGLQAAPMGLRAKTSVAARNTVLVCGIAMLGVGDLCYAFLPSVLGEAAVRVLSDSVRHLVLLLLRELPFRPAVPALMHAGHAMQAWCWGPPAWACTWP